jgi:hypothetical protein
LEIEPRRELANPNASAGVRFFWQASLVMKSVRISSFISLAMLIALAGCGTNAATDPATRQAAVLPVDTPAVATPPAVEKPRTARELIASAPLDIDRKAPFAEFSKRIAKARQDQKVLPCGHPELDRLYHLVVSRGFQGAGDAQEVNQQLDRWVNEDTSDPTPQIAVARAALNQAYTARGAEYGSVVSQRRLERFALLLSDAHSRAREALNKGADDPEVYRLLLETGFELKVPPAAMKEWMEDAAKRGPKYYPLYALIAKITKSEPDGKYPMLARLAREAKEKHSGDDGLEIYARIALAANRSDRRAILRSGFDLPTLNAGAKVLLQRYPQAAELIDFIGVVAYLSDDMDLAREILPELDSRKPNLADWGEERHWNRFKRVTTLAPVKDKPERVIWPAAEGVSSMVFVDRGRHVATTGGDPQYDAVCIWPLMEQNVEPHHVQAPNYLGSRLDADRQGERLFAYDASSRGMIVRMFDLSKGSVPGNLTNLVWYRPTIQPESELLNLNQVSRKRPPRSFFEISGDGKVAMAYAAGQVELFEPGTGKKLKTFATPGLSGLEPWGRHLSADGKWLALQGDNLFEVWDCEQGKKHCEISDATIKSDYLMVFAGLLSNQTALLQSRKRTTGMSQVMLGHWDWEKQQLQHLAPIPAREQAFALLGDDFVACATSHGMAISNPEVSVYRIRDGKRVRSIQGHHVGPISGRFSPDGSWLATWETNGPVKMWKIPVDAVP